MVCEVEESAANDVWPAILEFRRFLTPPPDSVPHDVHFFRRQGTWRFAERASLVPDDATNGEAPFWVGITLASIGREDDAVPYLLRAHGEERVERYGGVDPEKFTGFAFGLAGPVSDKAKKAKINLGIAFPESSQKWRDQTTREALHAHLGGVSKRLECPPLIIGGVEDHVHLLCRFGRTITQAEWVKELKRVSNGWLKGWA